MASLKALTLASVAVLALTRFATAADLLPPPPAPEPPPPIAEFSGWYLRGDIGAAFNNNTPSFENSPNPLSSTDTFPAGANSEFQQHDHLCFRLLGDVGVGYQLNNWLRGDITGEYRDGGHFQSLYVLNNPMLRPAISPSCSTSIGPTLLPRSDWSMYTPIWAPGTA